MYKIETKGYSSQEKLIIAKKYLIPKIIKDLNSEQEIELTDENIKYIINNFTNSEDGVRNLKRCLETIYKKINLYKYIESDDDVIKLKQQLVVLQEKVSYMDSVIRMINNRGFQIKNALDWLKFTNGNN